MVPSTPSLPLHLLYIRSKFSCPVSKSSCLVSLNPLSLRAPRSPVQVFTESELVRAGHLPPEASTICESPGHWCLETQKTPEPWLLSISDVCEPRGVVAGGSGMCGPQRRQGVSGEKENGSKQLCVITSTTNELLPPGWPHAPLTAPCPSHFALSWRQHHDVNDQQEAKHPASKEFGFAQREGWPLPPASGRQSVSFLIRVTLFRAEPGHSRSWGGGSHTP